MNKKIHKIFSIYNNKSKTRNKNLKKQFNKNIKGKKI